MHRTPILCAGFCLIRPGFNAVQHYRFRHRTRQPARRHHPRDCRRTPLHDNQPSSTDGRREPPGLDRAAGQPGMRSVDHPRPAPLPGDSHGARETRTSAVRRARRERKGRPVGILGGALDLCQQIKCSGTKLSSTTRRPQALAGDPHTQDRCFPRGTASGCRRDVLEGLRAHEGNNRGLPARRPGQRGRTRCSRSRRW